MNWEIKVANVLIIFSAIAIGVVIMGAIGIYNNKRNKADKPTESR